MKEIKKVTASDRSVAEWRDLRFLFPSTGCSGKKLRHRDPAIYLSGLAMPAKKPCAGGG
jgi:hypothetical protein